MSGIIALRLGNNKAFADTQRIPIRLTLIFNPTPKSLKSNKSWQRVFRQWQGTGVLPWSILTINLNLLFWGQSTSSSVRHCRGTLHLDLRFSRLSFPDINSTTKSGARAGTYLDHRIKSINLSCLTHAASGERSAPLGLKAS